MPHFISLCTQGRYGEIMVNVDEISSCHIEGGFSYPDYILILKNGTRYNLNSESYHTVINLISEQGMTDKVQKIREEVERLRSLHQIKYQHLDTNDNMSLVECGKRNLCNELLSFIDSLQEEPVSKDLEEASKEWLSLQLDKSYAVYGETKQMELTHFDGYAMLDAIEFGAKWQKQQDQATIELAEDHAMLAGMEKMKEEMMAKAYNGEVVATSDNGWESVRVYKKKEHSYGQKVKVIVIKED